MILTMTISCLQIAPFFASDGPAVTNPGSELSVSIYPSYYNGVATVRSRQHCHAGYHTNHLLPTDSVRRLRASQGGVRAELVS